MRVAWTRMVAALVLGGAVAVAIASGSSATTAGGAATTFGVGGVGQIVRATAPSFSVAALSAEPGGHLAVSGLSVPQSGYTGVVADIDGNGSTVQLSQLQPALYTVAIGTWPTAAGRMVAALLLNSNYSNPRYVLLRLAPGGGGLDSSYGDNGAAALPAGACSSFVQRGDGALALCGTQVIAVDANGAVDRSWGSSGSAQLTDGAVKAAAIDEQGRTVLEQNAGSSGAGCVVGRLGSDGTPDTAFGDVGTVVVSSVSDCDGPAAPLAVRGDGSVLVARTSTLLSFDADGQPTAAFGTNGKVQGPLGTSDPTEPFSFAVDGAGRVVIAPLQTAGSAPYELRRLGLDGQPDPGFGTAGRVTLDGVARIGPVFAIDDQSRILIAQQLTSPTGASTTVRVRRLALDGSPDADYAGTGAKEIEVPQPADQILAGIGLDSDGAIATASAVFSSQGWRGFGHRLLPTGFSDPTFAGGATPIAPPAGGSDLTAFDAAATTDHGAVVLASMHTGSPPATFATRLNADGSVDRGFGLGGRASFYDGTTPLELAQILPDGTGFIARVTGDTAPAVIRFTATGELDPTFGTLGIALLQRPGRGTQRSMDMVRDSDGTIDVSVADEQHGRTYYKLTPSGTVDPQTPDPTPGPPNAQYQPIAVDSMHRVILGGNDPQAASGTSDLVRYLPDGTLDQSFGTGGHAKMTASGFAGTLTDLAVMPDDGPVGTLAVSLQIDATDVEKLLPDGTPDPAWAHPYSLTSIGTLNTIRVDSDGNVLLAGGGRGFDQHARPILLKLNGQSTPAATDPTTTSQTTPTTTTAQTTDTTPTTTTTDTGSTSTTTTTPPTTTDSGPTSTTTATTTPTTTTSTEPPTTTGSTPTTTPAPAQVTVDGTPLNTAPPVAQPPTRATTAASAPTPTPSAPVAIAGFPPRRAATVARHGLKLILLSTVTASARIDIQISARDQHRYHLARRRLHRTTRPITAMSIHTYSFTLPRALRSRKLDIGARVVLRNGAHVLTTIVADTHLG